MGGGGGFPAKLDESVTGDISGSEGNGGTSTPIPHGDLRPRTVDQSGGEEHMQIKPLSFFLGGGVVCNLHRCFIDDEMNVRE